MVDKKWVIISTIVILVLGTLTLYLQPQEFSIVLDDGQIKAKYSEGNLKVYSGRFVAFEDYLNIYYWNGKGYTTMYKARGTKYSNLSYYKEGETTHLKQTIYYSQGNLTRYFEITEYKIKESFDWTPKDENLRTYFLWTYDKMDKLKEKQVYLDKNVKGIEALMDFEITNNWERELDNIVRVERFKNGRLKIRTRVFEGNASFDPEIVLRKIENIIYTHTTETHCQNGKCQMISYSGTRFIKEDKIWKPIEEAKSLKDKGNFRIVFLKTDERFQVKIIDFNYTAVKVKLKSSKINTPIKIERLEKKKTLKIGKTNLKIKHQDFLREKNEEKIITIPMRIGDIFTFGTNSTTTKFVAVSSDDASDYSGYYSHTATALWLGKEYNGNNPATAGLKFNNIPIPQGATINNASVSLVADWNYDALNLKVSADDVDNSATFAEGTKPSTRTKTTAQIDWDCSWSEDTRAYSGNISTVIKEIVDRASWSSGNNLSIIVADDGSGDWTSSNVYAYDSGSSSYYPKLIIDYTSTDSAKPLWRNQSCNNTSPAQGDYILLRAEGYDNTALHEAILCTNESGTWKNHTKRNIIVWEDHDYWADFSPGSPHYNYNYTYKNITDTLINEGMYQSLGVIANDTDGNDLSRDSQLVDYLNSIKGNASVEIMLHSDVVNEYENYSTSETRAELENGQSVLFSNLGLYAEGFVPAGGGYNNSAMNAYVNNSVHNFTRFSTYDYEDLNDWEEIDGLLHVPITTEFIDWDTEEMYSASEIITDCNNSLNSLGICVLCLHFKTFANTATQTVNATKYQILKDVITWVNGKSPKELRTVNGTTYYYIHDYEKDMGDVQATWTWSNFTWYNNTLAPGTTVGWKIYYKDSAGNVNVTSVNTFTTASADTCTYTSGNWAVTCSDNCSFASTDVGGNNVSITGSGGTAKWIMNITNYTSFVIKGGCTTYAKDG